MGAAGPGRRHALRRTNTTAAERPYRLSPYRSRMERATAGAGPLGGADNERGSYLRAAFAALAVSYGLRGHVFEASADRRSHGVPATVRCEVDEPVDDVEIVLTCDTRIYAQVKSSLSLS